MISLDVLEFAYEMSASEKNTASWSLVQLKLLKKATHSGVTIQSSLGDINTNNCG
jgi:hypothetical protein